MPFAETPWAADEEEPHPTMKLSVYAPKSDPQMESGNSD